MKRILLRFCTEIVVCFILTFLLSSVRFGAGLSPFYGGAYLTMLAMGGNFLSLSAAYALARFAEGRAWRVLLQGAFLVLGAGVPQLVSLIKRRRIHPFYTVICAFFAEIPTMFFLPAASWLIFLASSALSCLFTFLLFPLFIKIQKGALLFAEWEVFVTSVACFALGAGAYAVEFFGLSPYYLLLAFLLPVSENLLASGALPLSFALGAAALSSTPAPVLAAAIACVACEALRGRKGVTAFVLLVAEGAVYLLFGERYSLLNFLFLFSGAFVAAFLPDVFYRKCGAVLGRGERSAPHALVNRARLEIVGKLGYVGEALRKTSESLCELSSEGGEQEAAERLSEDFARSLCEGCAGRRDCAAQGGGSTAPLFQGAIERALINGQATICDLPTYLNGNCRKVKSVLEALNGAAEFYREERDRCALRTEERERLAGEAAGIAGVLDVLRRDLRRTVSFDGKREKRILAELRGEGIPVTDAMIVEGEGYLSVAVTMEEEDAAGNKVVEALSRAMDMPLLPEGITRLGAGAVAAFYRSAPPFDAVVGQAVRIKEGSGACGDNRSVTRLSGDRIMIALSDGMGSGERAGSGSSAAISLVENFYRTGVDEKTVLPLINNLLTMRNDGSFQTLDMCVVDLRTAEADFIKLSAPESVIKRKVGCEVVEGGALPLGILREVKPSISRKKLSSGDVVVLATDGVTDAIGADGMMRVAESGRSNNPQTIADNIVRDASFVSQADDQTVVALRLFRRVG